MQREFEIIDEAISRILKLDADLSISNARRIVDLQNWVIHGDDKVDVSIIWGIISRDLPLLKREVDMLLNLPDKES